MKQYMCWTYKVYWTYIVASKLPQDWVIQGLTMGYKVAYLVKTYSIPPALVVNRDQIGVHLVPNGDKRIWEPKGTKLCKVTMVV
jgi:hypothetical protein